MIQKKLSREMLHIAILTLITILFWVGFVIYRAYTKTTVSPDVRKQLTPLNPKLDTQIINNLNSKRGISLEEIRSFSFQTPPIVKKEEVKATPEIETENETGNETENEGETRSETEENEPI